VLQWQMLEASVEAGQLTMEAYLATVKEAFKADSLRVKELQAKGMTRALTAKQIEQCRACRQQSGGCICVCACKNYGQRG
jgi:hypothetical protein